MNDKILTKLLAVVITLTAGTAATGADGPGTGTGSLVFQKGTVVWKSAAGRAVRIGAPQLTVADPQDQTRHPMKVALTKHSVSRGEAVLNYALSLSEKGFTIGGTATVTVTLPRQAGEDV
jgi:hypothetical protein